MRLSLLALAFVFLAACASSPLPPTPAPVVISVPRSAVPTSTTTTGLRNDETPDIPCVAFSDPQPFVCAIGDQKVNIPTLMLCQLHDPDRYIFYTATGETLTFFGASCFSIIDQAM